MKKICLGTFLLFSITTATHAGTASLHNGKTPVEETQKKHAGKKQHHKHRHKPAHKHHHIKK